MLTISDLPLGINIMWTDLTNPFDPETKVAIVYEKEVGRAFIAPVRPADPSTMGYHERSVILKGYKSIYEGILDETQYEYCATVNTLKPCRINDGFLADKCVAVIPDTDPMPAKIIAQLQGSPCPDEPQMEKPVRCGSPSTPSAKDPQGKDGPEPR